MIVGVCTALVWADDSSFGVLKSLHVKNSTPYRFLGKKWGMEPRTSQDFRSCDRLLFIIIKDPLFFLFALLGFLGSTEPRLFSTSSSCTSYRLLDMFRKRLFPSRRFTYAMFIVSVQANKGMKVNESRKTSVILFIHERHSHPRIGLHN